jgi:membrane protein implicated in regulation of membrane protease activity
MIKRGWSYKIIFRYSLLQLPGLAFIICILFVIRPWFDFSLGVIGIVALVSIAIDILLFFITWPSYDWEQKDTLVGKTGIALSRIDPAGYIRIRGEQWKAELMEKSYPVEKGGKAIVCAREGLVLHVQPDNVQLS